MGVFASVGAFHQVAESMHELCLDCGVRFQFDTSVTAITDEGVRFVTRDNPDGEEVEKGYLAADFIICNADVPFATETIVRPELSMTLW